MLKAKAIRLFLSTVFLLIFMVCLPQNVFASEKILEIREKMFAGQIDDIYLNPKKYDGKLVHIVGMYQKIEYDNKCEHSIFRYTKGACPCCGQTGMTGFIFEWSGHLPKENETWIDLTGRVKIKNTGGFYDVKLAAISLDITKPQKKFVN